MDEIILKGLDPLTESKPTGALSRPFSKGSHGFGEILREAVEAVNSMQHEAGRLEDAVAKGENVNIHQAIIAGEKAGLSFRLMMQIRNKMLEAYEEVMRIRV